MTPRVQRPGYAAAGQYFCRSHTYNPTTRKVTGICGKPVPAGELPHLAYNSTQGDYLALCGDCRAELAEMVEDFVGASLGTARLLADLVALPTGELVSEADIREVLARKEKRKRDKKGPLSAAERKVGLDLLIEERKSAS